MIDFLRSLFRRKPEAEPVPATGGEGPLFGLSPPPGCQFEVSNLRGESWHVKVVRGGETLAHECQIIDRYGSRPTDEFMVVRVAQRALQSFEIKQAAQVLEGLYPPKVAKRGGPDA